MSGLVLSIHQPAYLPWIGYLDRIARSDLFVFLDTVQFQKNSFQNRNRVRTAQGDTWLTVPVKSRDHIQGSLLDIEISAAVRWQVKHLRTLEQAYSKAPHFGRVMEWLRPFYEQSWSRLSELCWAMLEEHLNAAGIKTKLLRASELDGIDGRKSELILSIARRVEADTYLSGPLGLDYLDRDSFVQAGIELDVHKFEHPNYRQLREPFIAHMAAVDRMMCEGKSIEWR
ncbi:MAG: hypothetical protein GKS00_02870 [Alphaproteobacteria bacterium]|nr:hypothetical protein [Alphaproteobacteria bacterium]